MTSTSTGKRVIFEPRRDQPAPGVTRGGGRRNDSKCWQDRQSSQAPAHTQSLGQLLTPLLRSPLDEPQLTVLTHPTFLVYIPQTSAKTVAFALEDADGNGIYQTAMNLTGTPGIISISLPTTVPELEIGKDYKWIVSVVCQTGAPEDWFAEGSVRRIHADSSLSQVEQVEPLEQITLYAKSGIWFETVANLAVLRKAQPNNPEITAAWEELLDDAGLGAIANAPLQH
ncbi:MAG TPA: DUF928 domain-containing protein [Coleofasciculaceae cyanobacterium]